MRAGRGVGVQEESSEYETDSDDDVGGGRMLKPTFVPRAAREVSGSMRA